MENLTLNRDEMQNDDITLRGQLEVELLVNSPHKQDLSQVLRILKF